MRVHQAALCKINVCSQSTAVPVYFIEPEGARLVRVNPSGLAL